MTGITPAAHATATLFSLDIIQKQTAEDISASLDDSHKTTFLQSVLNAALHIRDYAVETNFNGDHAHGYLASQQFDAIAYGEDALKAHFDHVKKAVFDAARALRIEQHADAANDAHIVPSDATLSGSQARPVYQRASY